MESGIAIGCNIARARKERQLTQEDDLRFKRIVKSLEEIAR